MHHKKEICFLLSVDTEEEWDWEGPFPKDSFSVQNLHELPKFQKFCENIGLRPCYFVDYPAAKQLNKQTTFMQSVTESNCELGAHLHPWANPPYFGESTDENSHVVNLPFEQVEAKVDELLSVFSKELNCRPKAFRTGRWGVSEEIMSLLVSRGFDIDSSVYPFYKNQYFDCEGSPLQAYWPDLNDVLRTGKQRNLLEMPVTVGFNRSTFYKASAIHRICQQKILAAFKTTALLWHSRLLRKIYFSPEVSTSSDMIDLAEASIRNGGSYLHMYLHSSNLIDNSTGFLQATNAHNLILKRIEEVTFHLSKRYHLRFFTPSEYKVYLSNNRELIAS